MTWLCLYRRGISNFYNGKSKSFTTLADAVSSPSVKDIAKPENAYTRRRRNLMALNHVLDKNNRNYPLRSSGGGICKRSISLSRSSLALAVAMNNSDSSSSITSDDSGSSSNSIPPPSPLPPLHPRNRVSSLEFLSLEIIFLDWSPAALCHCCNNKDFKSLHWKWNCSSIIVINKEDNKLYYY